MFDDLKSVIAQVRAALRRRGASPHDADDIAQEAWLRMARHLQGRTVPNPQAYLMRTAINLATDAHRARRVRGEEQAVEDLPLADVAPGAEAVLLAKQRMQRVGQCLDRMPERTRNIFLAHRVADRTYADIGREFGISETVVGKHVAKATALLACWMHGW